MNAPMSMREVCAALGMSRQGFYAGARRGVPAISYLLSRCMRTGQGRGFRRRWDVGDVEHAKQLLREPCGRRT